MGFRVTLQPSGHAFEVTDDKTVLAAGLDAGLNLPYSCRTGSCMTCRGHILEGQVTYGRSNPTYFSEADKAAGYAFLCQAKPLSDLTVEVKELEWQLPKATKSPCRVKQIKKLAPDVVMLKLRIPYNDNMLYAPGQYIDFLLPDGARRSYSIASPPSLAGVMDLELHIRHLPGGKFTDFVFNQLKPADILQFEGPLGTFHLRDKSEAPIVFLASGTGFGPIKAMIEYAFTYNITRPMTLYWGCRAKRDLYLFDLAEKWAAEHENFRFVPVLSDAVPEDNWTGRTGFVHQAVIADIPDLSAYEVYACGAPVMVESARNDFTQKCRLPGDMFFADAFFTEAELAKEPA